MLGLATSISYLATRLPPHLRYNNSRGGLITWRMRNFGFRRCHRGLRLDPGDENFAYASRMRP